MLLEGPETLVSPFGVVADVQVLRAPRGFSEITSCLAFSDFLPLPITTGRAEVIHRSHPGRREFRNTGHGATLGNPSDARLIAIAEAAERYSAGDFQQPVVWAAHRDLDGAALDPERIPRCSARELAEPGCPLSALDVDARIRWVRGTDLAGGAVMWVPAIMAFYGLSGKVAAEHFWYPISTGFAVHSDPAEALVRGICEVVERDALAVTWLQQLRLPAVADSHLSDSARRLLSWARRHFIDTYLLDATTDLGVPTAFCLQIAPHDERRRQILGCATGRSLTSAADKALVEACLGHSRAFRDDDPPESFADFRAISDSSRFMEMPSRAPAFSFLMDGAGDRFGPDRESMPQNSADCLDWLITSLSARDMQVAAVDRTTSEMAAAGLTAVNVVIPDLQPMTLVPLAQYRAHPRLYSAPGAMGYPSLTEEELNPWPVPYA